MLTTISQIQFPLGAQHKDNGTYIPGDDPYSVLDRTLTDLG